jgi:hypothetical protein
MSAQYFAQVTNGVVTHVAVVTAEFMAENPERYAGEWVETFVDKPNHRYASVGMLWNGTNFSVPPLPVVEPE